jgi:hypothetical protein
MGTETNRDTPSQDGQIGRSNMALSVTKATIDQLRDAIERMHGGSATLAQSVPVRETFEGKPVWEGVVHVFDLTGHRTATRAYAWSSPIEGSSKRRFVAVLHQPPVDSPLAAVRAAIVAEHKKIGGEDD